LLPTISAYHFDDEPALGLSWAIFDNDIALFNAGVFLSRWINSSAFEDWDQSLEAIQQPEEAVVGHINSIPYCRDCT
jgi:hypothetical protein